LGSFNDPYIHNGVLTVNTPFAFIFTGVYRGAMNLREFLDTTGQTQAEFGRAVGVSREAVRLWCEGERYPEQASMKRIRAVTNGQVTADDMLGAG
jgi:DNA-binding XRE family transcriptional regulator